MTDREVETVRRGERPSATTAMAQALLALRADVRTASRGAAGGDAGPIRSIVVWAAATLALCGLTSLARPGGNVTA